jgi:hypothetical protein
MKRSVADEEELSDLKSTFENLLRLPKDIVWRIFFLSGDLTIDKIRAAAEVHPRIADLLNNETLWDLMFISKIMGRQIETLEFGKISNSMINAFRDEREFRQWTALKEDYPDHFARFAAFAYYQEIYDNKRNVIFADKETKDTVLLIKNTSRTELQGVDDMGERERKKVFKTIEEITFLLKTDDNFLRDILDTTVNETARGLDFGGRGGGGRGRKTKKKDTFEFVQSKFTMLETVGKLYRIIVSGQYFPRLATGKSSDFLTKNLCIGCLSSPAKFQCGGCMSVKYCSESCQAKDWKETHNKIC